MNTTKADIVEGLNLQGNIGIEEYRPLDSVRRYVTGLDDAGKSVVLFQSDEVRPPATEMPVMRDIWSIGEYPPSASKEDEGKAELSARYGPGPQKVVFRIIDFPPSPPAEVIATMDLNMAMTLAGDEAPKRGLPPTNPFSHRTKTIDFGVVVSGEIDMVLDDSTVHLKPGDVVVQQQTNHAWINNEKTNCRIAFIQMEAVEVQ